MKYKQFCPAIELEPSIQFPTMITAMLRVPWSSLLSLLLLILICIFNALYIRGAFNRFPDFFLYRHLKLSSTLEIHYFIAIHLMRWLTNFMISGSNQQLQQQLEYTLLNPDCHSWWISKMESGREDNLEERYAIKLCFKLGKNATETYEILQTASGASCMNQASDFQWHKKFKEDTESVRDDERCGRITPPTSFIISHRSQYTTVDWPKG